MQTLMAREADVYSHAGRFLAGCGWYAMVVGGGIGLCFGVYSQTQSGLIDPEYLRQLFTDGLLGRLPTLLVAAFVLLRVNFQIATDRSFQRFWSDADQGVSYVLACGLTCLLAWAWFFLAVLSGTWLGMMQSHSGYGHVVWVAYWGGFEFQALAHAAVRMLLLSACLSVLTFFELRLLKADEAHGHAMMSRSMILGMVMIVAIEILDLLWQMN